ncbi:hypothetical protein [Streptomyces longwoodensis]|uniref:hypothetical protein n=1 Tax=Streptomyces TaxID=1883 RepID=UPI0036D1EAD3
MLNQPVDDRTVKTGAVRAAVFAVLGSALAAGLHHATGDSPVSVSAVVLAACALFLASLAAFVYCSPRVTAVLLAAAQAALPAWLNATEPQATSDGHYRLPPAWHHGGPAMAALNFVLALALAWLLRSACELPARLVNTCLAPARQWLLRLAYALTPGLPLAHGTLPPGIQSQSSDAPPPPAAFLVLRHQRVPCGP